MPIRRIFLGLDRPALWAASDHLLERYRRGGVLDLKPVIVVVPGSRAGRRLLEILVERCEHEKLLLTPPLIATVGHLPEQLYPPQRPFASDLVQRLAWQQALQAMSAEQFAPVVPNPPQPGDDEHWLKLADLFRKQHVELAADDLKFRDVAERGRQLEGFDESDRWLAMAAVQDRYHGVLDELGLWDPQTARLVAIDRHECHTEHDILLLGAVDMNVALRHMLDQVADRVTALIVAPPDWQDRFDEHGCLVPAHWAGVEIPLATTQIAVVEGPNAQATEVLSTIANYNGRFRADDITIGVPDEELTPDITRVLTTAGLATRWGPGESILGTGPCRLLATLADYLSRHHFRDFAALVRHPDVEAWLHKQVAGNRWLLELDKYHTDHLPARLRGEWLGEVNQTRELRRAFDALRDLTQPLVGEPRDVSLWVEPVLRVVATIYGDRVLSRDDAGDRAILVAGEELRFAMDGFTHLPIGLAPRLTAAQTIRWALEQLAGTPLPPPPNPDAIEMLGWLELPLDDAPALIVTTLNEGFVPESINSDLFLPNRLREQLGLMDNARRYARDAYALSVMIKSRTELRVIVGRRNHEGDPLIPSRLLFATDRDTAVQRALRFFRPQPVTSPMAVEPVAATSLSGFEIPRPQPLAQPIEQLSVTGFRDYIACPYRFYLRRVLKLEAVHDHGDELDGGAFGELAHEVLRRFGESPVRDSTEPDEIAHGLDQALNDVVAQWYGHDALAVVHVQVEQLRLRLHSFAQRQAEWAAEGWRIERTELVCSGEQAALFPVDDQPFYLTGRIDRIDVHVESGRRMVFDYKTSDIASTPREAHLARDNAWLDLQLPLYRHLAAAHGYRGPIDLSYILLPKDTARVAICAADWTAEELAAADERARTIIRAIRDQVFWPPVQPPPDFSEDFAAICQDMVFG